MFQKFLFTFLTFLTLSIISVVAQPGGPGGDPGNSGTVGTGVPLDGGAIFMLIAGVAYGIKRLRGKSKE